MSFQSYQSVLSEVGGPSMTRIDMPQGAMNGQTWEIKSRFNPKEYALVKRWDLDPANWTQAQVEQFEQWDGVLATIDTPPTSAETYAAAIEEHMKAFRADPKGVQDARLQTYKDAATERQKQFGGGDEAFNPEEYQALETEAIAEKDWTSIYASGLEDYKKSAEGIEELDWERRWQAKQELRRQGIEVPEGDVLGDPELLRAIDEIGGLEPDFIQEIDSLSRGVKSTAKNEWDLEGREWAQESWGKRLVSEPEWKTSKTEFQLQEEVNGILAAEGKDPLLWESQLKGDITLDPFAQEPLATSVSRSHDFKALEDIEALENKDLRGMMERLLKGTRKFESAVPQEEIGSTGFIKGKDAKSAWYQESMDPSGEFEYHPDDFWDEQEPVWDEEYRGTEEKGLIGDLEGVGEAPKLDLGKMGLSLEQQMLLAEKLPFGLGSGSFIDSAGKYFGSVEALSSTFESLAGMGAAALFVPKLSQWLDSLGTGGKAVSGVIEIAGWAQSIMADNPIGLALYLGQTYIGAITKQRQRILSNDFGDRIDSTKFGWVLDNGIWYPAVVRKKEAGEGLFDQSNKLLMAYGKNMSLMPDGTGKLRGEFPLGEKIKEFGVKDFQWEDYGSFTEMNKDYPFRQWYVMSDAERNDLFSKYGTDAFQQSFHTHAAEEGDFTPYMKKNSDVIRGLDIIKNMNNKSHTESEAIVPAGRAFIRAFDDFSAAFGGWGSRGLDIRGGMFGDRPEKDGILGEGGWWDSNMGPGKASLSEWRAVTTGIAPNLLQDLERIRRKAAESVGIQWQGYLDNAKDIPVAQSSAELDEQIKLIDGYTDRNETQRDYLKNKAGARYVMGRIGDMGYSRLFSDRLYAEGDPQSILDKLKTLPGYMEEAASGSFDTSWEAYNLRFEQLGKRGVYGTKWGLVPNKYENVGTKKWDQEHPDTWVPYNTSVTKLPSWLNAGESTIPDWMDMSRDPSYREWENEGQKYLNLFRTEYDEKFGNAGVLIDRMSKQMTDANKAQKDAIDQARKEAEKAAEDALQKKVDADQAYADAFASAIDRIRIEQERRAALPYVNQKWKSTKFINKAGFHGLTRDKTWADYYAYRQSVKDKNYHEKRGAHKRAIEASLKAGEDSRNAEALKQEALRKSRAEIDYNENRLDKLDRDEVLYDPETNKRIDYARVMQAINDPHDSPDLLLNETSLPMFYEKYLKGMYSWQPNSNLTEGIMPPGYIESLPPSLKEGFKPMLEAVQEDNTLRGRAQGLYDKVYAPTVEKYVEKFHPDPANLAKDAAGVTELFDDWSLAYEKRHNQVKFNNQIHTQMDFNVQEDF